MPTAHPVAYVSPPYLPPNYHDCPAQQPSMSMFPRHQVLHSLEQQQFPQVQADVTHGYHPVQAQDSLLCRDGPPSSGVEVCHHLQHALVQPSLGASVGLQPSVQQQMSAHSGGPGVKAEVSSPSNLDLLYNITIKNPQYRPSDFIKLSNLPYSKKVDSKNINLSSFAFG